MSVSTKPSHEILNRASAGDTVGGVHSSGYGRPFGSGFALCVGVAKPAAMNASTDGSCAKSPHASMSRSISGLLSSASSNTRATRCQ